VLLYHQQIGCPDKKITKKTLELNDAIDQMDLTDLYRVFNPPTAQYTLLSAAHGTFSKKDHISGQKVSLNKCKKIEIISSISDHNTIKLECNSRKYSNTWGMSNTLLHDPWVIEGRKSKSS
jgi:hypothetical protein